MIEKLHDILVIYHGNCADGFGAAWCFWHMLVKDGTDGRKFNFHPGVYGETPPDVTDKLVYIVDFSYNHTVIKEMLKTAYNIHIIDHHKTAIEDLTGKFTENDNITFTFDIEHSGAMLAWQFLNGTDSPVPTMIKYIEDRDLWRFNLPFSKEISVYQFSWPYNFEIWELIHKNMNLEENINSTIIECGSAILRKHNKDIAELLEVTKTFKEISGHVVPVANLPYTMASDAADILAEGYPFAACYYVTDTHCVYSLRSTKDGIDVSAVAKFYGGGGHKHAAGFKIPINKQF